MKNKKLIFGVLFAGVLAVNTLVLSTTNNNDLQLNSLFTLASAQAEDGEDGEGYNPDQYYEGYYNETKVIYNFNGDISATLGSGVKLPVGVTIENGASGQICYCEDTILYWKKCYKDLLGWTPFTN